MEEIVEETRFDVDSKEGNVQLIKYKSRLPSFFNKILGREEWAVRSFVDEPKIKNPLYESKREGGSLYSFFLPEHEEYLRPEKTEDFMTREEAESRYEEFVNTLDNL